MGDSLERAIVQFVVEGAQGAEGAADRISAKLDSVERAGRQAEKAATDAASAAQKADAASRQLASAITSSISKMQAAAHLAQKAASLAGFEDGSAVQTGISLASAGFSGASRGAAIGGAIGSFVPVLGNAVGAAIGATIGGGLAVVEAASENDKRLEAAAARGAKLARENEQASIEDQLLREAGLSKLGNLTRGPREIQ